MAEIAVRERPILFSGPMVRAILEGRKTQTRRVVKPQPNFVGMRHLQFEPDRVHLLRANRAGGKIECPYGFRGARLWVRETWAVYAPISEAKKQYEDALAGRYIPGSGPYYRATEPAPDTLRWRPSIFMPRWACRIILEITKIRIEKLRQITTHDAIAEGVGEKEYLAAFEGERGAERQRLSNLVRHYGRPIAAYAYLWDSLNAKRGFSWDTNPWVWIVEFRRIV